MLNYTTKLTADTSLHDESLKKSVGEVYKYQKATEEAGDVMTKSIRQLMTELTKLVANLEMLGKTETKEYRDAVKHLSELKDQMGDITLMTSMMASDTKDLDIANKSLSSLVSVMGALQGVTAMTGTENEKLAKVMKSLQVVLGGVAAAISVANLAQKQFIQTFKSSPWGWIATAIGLVAGVLLTVADNSKEAKQAEEERIQAEKEAIEEENKLKTSNDAQAKMEINNMEQLIRKANDLTASYKERKKAVKELNEICPQANFYLKDEESQLKYNIKAYEDYVKAIQLAARAKAYEKLLQKSYEDNAPTELKAEELRLKFLELMKIRNDYSRPKEEREKANQESFKIQKELEPLNAILDEAKEKRKAINNIIYDIKTEIETLGGGKPKPSGSQIEKLTPLAELQKKLDKDKKKLEGLISVDNVITNIEEWAKLRKEIDETERKIKDIQNTINPTKKESISALEEQKKLLKELTEERTKLVNADGTIIDEKKFEEVNKKIKEVNDNIAAIGNVLNPTEAVALPIEGSINDLTKKLSEARDKFNNMGPDDSNREQLLSYIKQLQEEIDRLNGKVGETKNTFDSIGERNKALSATASNLGLVASKLKEIGATDLGAIVNVGAVIGQAVATMLLGYAETSEKAAKSVLNGASGGLYWTAYSLSALAQTLAIVSAIKSAGNFAQGGIVGGNTTVGDYNVIRANKGEMILNQREQHKLWQLLSGAGVPTNTIGGQVRFEIEGSKLYGVLNNYESKNKRIK